MKTKVIHQRIIKALKTKANPGNHQHYNGSYTGSRHFFYAVPVPERRAILRELRRKHKAVSAKEWVQLVDALISGESHEEKTMGAMLLGYETKAREAVGFPRLDRWLNKLVGWAEIDAFCYNVFTADELLTEWKSWQAFLRALAKDKNINKRRAALVYLTHPTTKSDDARLHELAYELIDRLKPENDILITKAISWLLRSMADTKPERVAAYLEKNEETLPKIATRETRKKLLTGKKN